ncbi:MAG: hypothetical protein K2N74_00500 [Clostridiales bacterium]|nr:hypothetical protein [Clostridiales bacterium]
MPKAVKRYDFSRKPLKPSKFWMWIARSFAIPPYFRGRKLNVNKIGMDGIKPPYLLFCTHAGMIDFPVMYRAIAPYNANNVVAIDAMRDVGDWLMRKLGCICKRKFVHDYHLIRNLKYCVDHYGIACMYPEARYSLDGTTSFLPESLAKISKLLKVPVVVLRMHGNFISGPQWNKEEKRVPLYAELELVATAEEAQALSVDELNEKIHSKLQIDDFAYQRDRALEIDNPRRANGLHHILYQCPHCGREFQMYSEGTRIWCASCGKAWQMGIYGELTAEEGETEFSHIPDWTKWERENVRNEVRSGTYRFEDEVTVHTLPGAKRFYDQGKGRLTQTADGTHLECTAYGEKVDLFWAGNELESVHIEYDYPYNKKKYRKNIFGDCVDISVTDDSYWLHPVNLRDQLTKISFATEEIYFLAQENVKKKN